MPHQTDSKENLYLEIPNASEHLRVTYILQSVFGEPSVRIQVRETNGHLRMGPEIPQSLIGEVIGCIVNLIVARSNSTDSVEEQQKS